MAKTTDILVGGVLTQVTEFDHTAQEIDDAVSIVGTSPDETRLNIGAASNPNLLDNWYFADPIDQRGGYICLQGTMVYGDPECTNVLGETQNPADALAKLSNGNYQMLNIGENLWYVKAEDAARGYVGAGYTIDRWAHIQNSVFEIRENGLLARNSCDMYQNLESPEKYFGKVMTVSMMVDGDVVSATGKIPNSFLSTVTALFSASNGSHILVVMNATKLWVTVQPKNGATVQGVKLELGSTQTLAHKEGDTWVLNDPPPNKQQELAKCQRYYVKLDGSLGMIIPGVNRGGLQTAIFEIPIPVTMRATPAVTDVVSYGECLINGTWYPVTNLNVDTAHAGSVRAFWGTNGVSDLCPCAIDGAKFAFSADL